MQVDIEKREHHCILKLTGDLTLSYAEQLKHTLLETLTKCTEIEIDLSEISDIDTAGVQLLILAKREANQKKQKLRLISHSQVVVEVLELLHLTPYFGDPVVLSADNNKRL